jgi:hypothetical protein
MSFRFGDSFNNESENQLRTKWNKGAGWKLGGLQGGSRSGGNCIGIYEAGELRWQSKHSPTAVPDENISGGWIQGCAINSSIQYASVLFYGVGGGPGLTLKINRLGSLSVGDENTNQVHTAPTIVGKYLSNRWFHVEFKVETLYLISFGTLNYTATGRINGETVITAVGYWNNGPIALNEMGIWFRGESGLSAAFCDYYAMDIDDGLGPSDFIGDLRVSAKTPNGVGLLSQWTPINGTGPNYTMVNEAPDDEEATYNYGTVTGKKDSYKISSYGVPTGSTIYGMQENMVAENLGYSNVKISSLTNPFGTPFYTNLQGAISEPIPGNGILLNYPYRTYPVMWQFNPATGLPWAQTDIDSVEFGQYLAQIF